MQLLKTFEFLSLMKALMLISAYGKNPLAFVCNTAADKKIGQTQGFCAAKYKQAPGNDGTGLPQGFTTEYTMMQPKFDPRSGRYDCSGVLTDSTWCCALKGIPVSVPFGNQAPVSYTVVDRLCHMKP
ncbi:hypothetical protein MJO29_003999 [Puccinia striiformis f. sp. tritici]|uniref:Hydrophobin n=4 Tax=Puccinia striiformis TaxID=27350 RepID=A0A0L0VEK0_9BASI|nr:hypothetical protein Pst134EA_007114 [Puccinia striiformis f. sp. tritici]KAI9608567.1 hypothetical protein H4Q26_004750 [Puccinia striiformis f. sp. tritici PST-130]KNE97737.1 hypothetical protein PSTG_08956 [Puccinia striiformis f. sp. tritici PST-78]POW11286.1 hypothetical protein PSHT_08523 [Puccinia striiformis]KAH9460049.1 hypothetical protein Pst134EB_008254 [Puccinia striiformis f. sp. tritici]KAH9469838.1 hypothetical protein Pst134EA_007114 [Puccinia striiformis f. sp. tritici]